MNDIANVMSTRPNGTSLVATYERSLNGSLENRTAFPAIPDQNTFVNLGLNTRPTFFGCNVSNITTAGVDTFINVAPLIVYLPNSPYTAMSNVSTFNLSYSDATRNGIITNGFNVATRANSSEDMWPTCVGCAILHRSLLRTGTVIPQICADCFASYCWNGTIDNRTPPPYEPTLAVNTTATVSESSGIQHRVGKAMFVPLAICLMALVI